VCVTELNDKEPEETREREEERERECVCVCVLTHPQRFVRKPIEPVIDLADKRIGQSVVH
jgi:hypothetical protein